LSAYFVVVVSNSISFFLLKGPVMLFHMGVPLNFSV